MIYVSNLPLCLEDQFDRQTGLSQDCTGYTITREFCLCRDYGLRKKTVYAIPVYGISRISHLVPATSYDIALEPD